MNEDEELRFSERDPGALHARILELEAETSMLKEKVLDNYCEWLRAAEERDALSSALEPFASAWRRRAPEGDPESQAYKRRMARALLPFLSNGNADESGVLTGEHLRDASDALEKSIASLVRRDARMKAEALEKLSEEYVRGGLGLTYSGFAVSQHLEATAIEYHKQAQDFSVTAVQSKGSGRGFAGKARGRND